ELFSMSDVNRHMSTSLALIYSFFFFSSRRRHTRWPRDWSSDVCSSDLERLGRPDVERGPSTRKVRVLVVDDEAANRTLLTEALEPTGFTVLPASGGREAIEIAKSSNPDLVLLDLIMTEVTSFDGVAGL